MSNGNLTSFFDAEDAPVNGERFDTLYRKGDVVIERIVSSGRQPVTRYCQPQDEWVMLLRGSATLLVDEKSISLQAGQYLTIPANVPHEVLGTSENALWLAVHLFPHDRNPESAIGPFCVDTAQ
jgi:cupin 2 domain-containing protein